MFSRKKIVQSPPTGAAERAKGATPERRERDLVWGTLFALRAQGLSRVDNTGGRIHQVFAKVLADLRPQVRRTIGFVPQPHPLFGEYRFITEALDSAHRAGLVGFVNPTYRQIILHLHRDAADGALDKLTVDPKFSRQLAKRFMAHYQESGAVQQAN